MIGAIIGDIAGSTFEFSDHKDPSAPLFPEGSDYTDDTVMTVATADALLNGTNYLDAYVKYLRGFRQLRERRLHRHQPRRRCRHRGLHHRRIGPRILWRDSSVHDFNS